MHLITQQNTVHLCVCRKPCAADFDPLTCRATPHTDWGVVVIGAVFYMCLLGYAVSAHRHAYRWAKKRGWL